jgi:hypothetical protein
LHAQISVRPVGNNAPPVVVNTELQANWELLKPDESSVKLIEDAARTETMRSALQFYTFDVNHKESEHVTPQPEYSVAAGRDMSCSGSADGLPSSVCDEVLVRFHDQTWDTHQQLILRKGRPLVFTISFSGLPFTDDHADVVLRPTKHLAEQTTDLTEIWGGEIVYHDVFITRIEPFATAPAVNPPISWPALQQ